MFTQKKFNKVEVKLKMTFMHEGILSLTFFMFPVLRD